MRGNFDRRLSALEARLPVDEEALIRQVCDQLSDLHLGCLVVLLADVKDAPALQPSARRGLRQLAAGVPWEKAMAGVYAALDELTRPEAG